MLRPISSRPRAIGSDRPPPAAARMGAEGRRATEPRAPCPTTIHDRGTSPSRLVPRSLLLVALALALGCGLFEPRDVEAPDEGTGALGRPPLSPGDVIHNLQEAVRAKDVELYRSALADSGWRESFHFVADPALALDREGDWGYDEEVAAWRNLCAQLELVDSPAPVLALSSADSTQFGDSASFGADYFLELDPQRDGLGGTWAGTLRLALSRHPGTGDWAIHRWEDWSADSTAGWTRLKQEFLWP